MYQGEWDNFLQYWQEQTEEDIHRMEIDVKHRHLHLKISNQAKENELEVKVFEGRNAKNLLAEKTIDISTLEGHLSNDNVLLLSDVFGEAFHEEPYRFIKCRQFSGWIQYPINEKPEEDFFQGDLVLHDQGAMAALNQDGVNYTIELTQLVFGHKIKIMKLAIYDLPLNEVGINSKAISYTWTSPESKRLGINLRKIVSGWTLIEDGFLSKNNME